MTPTPDPSTGATSVQLPTGDELYNGIMVTIEPELVLDAVPTLAQKYKNETPEEAQARTQRYNNALAEYDVRFAQHMQALADGVKSAQMKVRTNVEMGNKATEQVELDNLESSISSI